MRKITLLGFSIFVIFFGAFGADARSSDEEDAPQATVQSDHEPPLLRSHPGSAIKAEHKSPIAARKPIVVPQQENTFGGGY